MNNYYFKNRSIDFSNYIKEELDKKRKEILQFFEVEDNDEYIFNVYVYDTQEELVQGLLDRGFSKDPDHMCACSKDEDHSLNYFEPLDNSDGWTKLDYISQNVVMHEEVHGLEYYIYGYHPEWLCEGIAKYLDGKYKNGIKFLLDNYIDKDDNPATMYELINEFGMHQTKYHDVYDYSYIIVSYLIETEGKSNFVKKIYSKEYIKQLEESDILSEALSYYREKYKSKAM